MRQLTKKNNIRKKVKSETYNKEYIYKVVLQDTLEATEEERKNENKR